MCAIVAGIRRQVLSSSFRNWGWRSEVRSSLRQEGNRGHSCEVRVTVRSRLALLWRFINLFLFLLLSDGRKKCLIDSTVDPETGLLPLYGKYAVNFYSNCGSFVIRERVSGDISSRLPIGYKASKTIFWDGSWPWAAPINLSFNQQETLDEAPNALRLLTP